MKPDPLVVISVEQSQDEILSSVVGGGAAVVSLKSKNSSHKKKKHARNSTPSTSSDKDLLSRTWLKKITEVWNRPPLSPGSLIGSCSQRASSLADAERNAAAAEAAVDGRYAFKRRRGCTYRDVLASSTSNADIAIAEELEARLRGNPPSLLRTSAAIAHASHHTNTSILLSKADASMRFYKTFLPSSSNKGLRRCIGYARRRVGRGGRIIFDRIQCSSPPSTSQQVPDDLPHPYIDLTRTYEGRLAATEADDSDSSCSADLEEERLEQQRQEDYYSRRDELFRMRIFDGVTEPLCYGLQTGTISEDTYAAYVGTDQRQWTDPADSRGVGPICSTTPPPPQAQPQATLSPQRVILAERGSNFRGSISALKDGNSGTAPSINGYYPCSSVPNSICENGPSMAGGISSSTASIGTSNSSSGGGGGGGCCSITGSKSLLTATVNRAGSCSTSTYAMTTNPSNMLVNGGSAMNGPLLTNGPSPSNGILVLPSSSVTAVVQQQQQQPHQVQVQEKRIASSTVGLLATNANSTSSSSSGGGGGGVLSMNPNEVNQTQQLQQHQHVQQQHQQVQQQPTSQELPIFYPHLPSSQISAPTTSSSGGGSSSSSSSSSSISGNSSTHSVGMVETGDVPQQHHQHYQQHHRAYSPRQQQQQQQQQHQQYHQHQQLQNRTDVSQSPIRVISDEHRLLTTTTPASAATTLPFTSASPIPTTIAAALAIPTTTTTAPTTSASATPASTTPTPTVATALPIRIPFRQTPTKRLNNGADSRAPHLAHMYSSSFADMEKMSTINNDSPRMRVNGSKRSKSSSSTATLMAAHQLASSIVAEANLKRLAKAANHHHHHHNLHHPLSMKLNTAESTIGVVDTKRLELAIAGSGARIKVPPLNTTTTALCAASMPMSGGGGGGCGIKEANDTPKPLIEALKAAASPPSLKAMTAPTNCCYSSSNNRHHHHHHHHHHYNDTATLITSGTISPTLLTSCCIPSDNFVGITSSPDSESMSPPLSTSPAVVPELRRRHFGALSDPKPPTPVAVVSGSVNMNGINTGLLADKTR